MITLEQFRRIEAAVRDAGYGDAIAWSEGIAPPATATEFAEHAIYVICNSGMKNSVAVAIHRRCMAALRGGGSATAKYGHPGKAFAIDRIWRERAALFEAHLVADDKLAFLATLPWIGPITVYHLAKNLGGDFAKPDVHLNRLAAAEGCTAQKLCERLARDTGYRAATVDTILWRACEQGIISSAAYCD